MRWRKRRGGEERPAAGEAVEGVLDASGYADCSRVWLSVGDSLPVLDVEVTGRELLPMLGDLGARLPRGWDLVATTRWAPHDAAAIERQLQNRNEFAWAHHVGFGPEPASFGADDLIDAAASWTDEAIDRRFAAQESDRDAMRTWQHHEVIDYHLAATLNAVGTAPGQEAIPAAIPTEAALDRWLLDWELENATPPRDRVQDWFEVGTPDQPLVIRIFPRTAPFAAIAIEHWWASDMPFALAAMQRWQRRYGARLIAHFGTMLHIVSSTCPTDLEEAWGLAREQHLLCDALLEPSGEARRHLALGLMHEPRWFLHSRP